MRVYGVFFELNEYGESQDPNYMALRCIFDTREKAEGFVGRLEDNQHYFIEELIMNSEEERGK